MQPVIYVIKYNWWSLSWSRTHDILWNAIYNNLLYEVLCSVHGALHWLVPRPQSAWVRASWQWSGCTSVGSTAQITASWPLMNTSYAFLLSFFLCSSRSSSFWVPVIIYVWNIMLPFDLLSWHGPLTQESHFWEDAYTFDVLVYFWRTIFMFVCHINASSERSKWSGAFCAADKHKNRASEVNKLTFYYKHN